MEGTFAVPVTLPSGREALPHIDVTQTRGNMTRSGAEKLARTIKTYWMMRGFEVEVWVERDRGVENAIDSRIDQRDYGVDPHWVVRSNMVGALPRAVQKRDGCERD